MAVFILSHSSWSFGHATVLQEPEIFLNTLSVASHSPPSNNKGLKKESSHVVQIHSEVKEDIEVLARCNRILHFGKTGEAVAKCSWKFAGAVDGSVARSGRARVVVVSAGVDDD